MYADCGKDYRLRVENGLLQTADTRPLQPDTVCLAELAQDAPGLDLMEARTAFPEEEQLAKELLQALEREAGDDASLDAAELGALPSWCRRFLERLEEFLEASQSDLPIDALFITPADLAYRTKNLQRIGEVQLDRK